MNYGEFQYITTDSKSNLTPPEKGTVTSLVGIVMGAKEHLQPHPSVMSELKQALD